uniref:Uncharacterized protein n=1 Tax=Glossina pallidipes TaxID=7398 RepID=A0A1A9ZCB5_GLOPL
MLRQTINHQLKQLHKFTKASKTERQKQKNLFTVKCNENEVKYLKHGPAFETLMRPFSAWTSTQTFMETADECGYDLPANSNKEFRAHVESVLHNTEHSLLKQKKKKKKRPQWVHKLSLKKSSACYSSNYYFEDILSDFNMQRMKIVRVPRFKESFDVQFPVGVECLIDILTKSLTNLTALLTDDNDNSCPTYLCFNRMLIHLINRYEFTEEWKKVVVRLSVRKGLVAKLQHKQEHTSLNYRNFQFRGNSYNNFMLKLDR